MSSPWLSDLIREIQLLGLPSSAAQLPLVLTEGLERLSPPRHEFEDAIGRYLLIRLLAQRGRLSYIGVAGPRTRWAEDLLTARDWQAFKHECLQSLSVTAPETHDERLVHAASSIIQRQIRDVSIASLARTLGCHRRTLERAFRRARNRSLHTHLIEVRPQVAGGLLTQTSLTCNAIAREVGFRSRTTLNLAVRRLTGRTPSQLRQTAADGTAAPQS